MLSPAHRALITDPANWLDNPLAVREARRDRKRKQPHKAYGWMLGTLSVSFVAMAWLIGWMHRPGVGVPWYLGGSVGTALCIAVCGPHTWFISGAVRKHTATLVWQEASRNTLPGLLTLPTPPFQLLLRTGVYPWFAAMRMAAAGLPFYLYCVAAGGLSLLDLAMLYLVFALMSLGFAAWTRPILSENAALAVPAAPQPQPAAQTSATGTQQPGQSQAGMAFFLPVIVMAFLMPALMTGGTRGVYSSLRTYAPDSVLQLAPTFLFSWPLLVARSLVTPFDWFGWRVVPLPFVLVFALLGRYLSLVRSSEFLSVGTYRDLAAQPTYLRRRVWEQRLKFATLLACAGYLWKWGIVDGALASFAPRGFAGTEASLAAFAYGVLGVTVWRWLGRVRTVAGWRVSAEDTHKKVKKPRLVVPRFRGSTLAAYLLSLPLAGVGFYLLCCLLARTAPLPAPIAWLALKMLAIGAAGGILEYAFVRATGLSSVAPGLCFVALVAFGPAETRVAQLVSPALGFLSLGPPSMLRWVGIGAGPPPGLVALFARTPPWWQWPLACGAVGLLFAAGIPIRRLLSSRTRTMAAVQPADEHSAAAAEIDPATVGAEVYFDALFEKKDADAKRESVVGLRLLEAGSRLTDNAVAVKEMRTRLRGKLGPTYLRGAAVVFGVVTIGLLGAPGFTLSLGGGMSQLLFGPLRSQTAWTVASILSLYYVVMTWMALSAGINILPLAFAPEREKSTLGFLLMTPMRSASIVFGKAVGLLCSNSAALLLMAAATLAISLLFSAAVGPLLALSIWLRCVTVAALVLVSTGLLAVGVAALFPRSINQAGCGGLLVGLMVQVPIQLLIRIGRVVGPLAAGSTSTILDSPMFWLVLVGATAGMAAIGWGAAMFGVWRIRRRDIAFEGSRREN